MTSPCSSHIPCDLLANFLTHSYFNLLEQHFSYIKHPKDTRNIQSLLKATQSFLFIFNQNPHSLALLDNYIFTYYKSYTELTSSRLIKPHSLLRVRKNYSKALLKASSNQDAYHCNESFIHLYYTTIFSYFSSESDLPSLYTVSRADTFVDEVKKLRQLLLKNTFN